jgi:hypothetical protein
VTTHKTKSAAKVKASGRKSRAAEAPGLTDKQIAFIEHYLASWSAGDAARRAGYSANSAYAIGWENLRKPEVRKILDERLAELKADADEVFARLTQQARASIEDFLDSNNDLDLAAARKAYKLHLIKKLKVTTRTIRRKGVDPEIIKTIEIELYDAQAALVNLGRIHGVFLDRTALGTPEEHDWAPSLTPEERAKRVAELLSTGKKRLAQEKNTSAGD